MELFSLVLDRCDRLIIAVTNPDTGARHADATSEHRHTASANPLTFYERSRLLQAATAHWQDRVTIVPFDLTRPALWRQYVPVSAIQFVRTFSPWEARKVRMLEAAGYPVVDIPGDPATRLSASDVRADLLAGGNHWERCVPTGVRSLIQGFAEAHPLKERV